MRLRGRLHDLGIAAHRGATVASIDPEGVTARDEFGAEFRLAADGVVLVTQRLSDDASTGHFRPTRGAKRDGVEAVYAIGDCVAPRLVADAIFDGHRLAREIDSPDPSRPLPYLRERPLEPVPGTQYSSSGILSARHSIFTPRRAAAST